MLGDVLASAALVATIVGVVVFVIVNWTTLKAFFDARPRVVMALWFALGLVIGAIATVIISRIVSGGGAAP